MTVEAVVVEEAATEEAVERRPSLSPSRAADFKTCPLLYRFRTIDRLPEQPTFDQARGTLVHAVLERLFDLPAADRTGDRAEARALFQLKSYALVLWRPRGVVPRVLRLLYLKDAEVCDYTPDVEELTRFERTLIALWAAIERATADKDFRPRPSRLCGWCAHQALCPAYDGTPPPFPERAPLGDLPGSAIAAESPE